MTSIAEGSSLTVPSLLNKETMAPVSAWRYISPRSATTGAAAVCTLIRLSPQDAVYLLIVKDILITRNLYDYVQNNSNQWNSPQYRKSNESLKKNRP